MHFQSLVPHCPEETVQRCIQNFLQCYSHVQHRAHHHVVVQNFLWMEKHQGEKEHRRSKRPTRTLTRCSSGQESQLFSTAGSTVSRATRDRSRLNLVRQFFNFRPHCVRVQQETRQIRRQSWPTASLDGTNDSAWVISKMKRISKSWKTQSIVGQHNDLAEREANDLSETVNSFTSCAGRATYFVEWSEHKLHRRIFNRSHTKGSKKLEINWAMWEPFYVMLRTVPHSPHDSRHYFPLTPAVALSLSPSDQPATAGELSFQRVILSPNGCWPNEYAEQHSWSEVSFCNLVKVQVTDTQKSTRSQRVAHSASESAAGERPRSQQHRRHTRSKHAQPNRTRRRRKCSLRQATPKRGVERANKTIPIRAIKDFTERLNSATIALTAQPWSGLYDMQLGHWRPWQRSRGKPFKPHEPSGPQQKLDFWASDWIIDGSVVALLAKEAPPVLVSLSSNTDDPNVRGVKTPPLPQKKLKRSTTPGSVPKAAVPPSPNLTVTKTRTREHSWATEQLSPRAAAFGGESQRIAGTATRCRESLEPPPWSGSYQPEHFHWWTARWRLVGPITENGRRIHITKRMVSEFGATLGCKGCLELGQPHGGNFKRESPPDPAHVKRLKETPPTNWSLKPGRRAAGGGNDLCAQARTARRRCGNALRERRSTVRTNHHRWRFEQQRWQRRWAATDNQQQATGGTRRRRRHGLCPGTVRRGQREQRIRRRWRPRCHRRHDRSDTLARRCGQSKNGRDCLVRQVRSQRRGDGRDMPVKKKTQAHLVSTERHKQRRPRAGGSAESLDRARSQTAVNRQLLRKNTTVGTST